MYCVSNVFGRPVYDWFIVEKLLFTIERLQQHGYKKTCQPLLLITALCLCEAVDDEVIKALGTMISISMPESVEEKCYGCTGVTDEVGSPKFFPLQRDHDVCCMMPRDEQVDYISEDVIRKIITTQN